MQVIQLNDKFVKIQSMCKNMTKRWNNDENDEKDRKMKKMLKK